MRKRARSLAVHDDIVQNLKVQLSIESKSPQDQREIGLAFVKLKAQGYKVALLSELFELSQPDLFRYYVLGRVPLTLYEAYLRSDITYTALISFGAIHRYAPNALRDCSSRLKAEASHFVGGCGCVRHPTDTASMG